MICCLQVLTPAELQHGRAGHHQRSSIQPCLWAEQGGESAECQQGQLPDGGMRGHGGRRRGLFPLLHQWYVSDCHSLIGPNPLTSADVALTHWSRPLYPDCLSLAHWPAHSPQVTCHSFTDPSHSLNMCQLGKKK